MTAPLTARPDPATWHIAIGKHTTAPHTAPWHIIDPDGRAICALHHHCPARRRLGDLPRTRVCQQCLHRYEAGER